VGVVARPGDPIDVIDAERPEAFILPPTTGRPVERVLGHTHTHNWSHLWRGARLSSIRISLPWSDLGDMANEVSAYNE
jgi:hypothetical protein